MKMKSKADVVVVGGGIIGLFSAYWLAKSGEEVVVIEKKYPGSGSTFRCGTGIRQQFGDYANIQMMKKSVEIWKNLGEMLEFPEFKFARTGYLFLLYSDEEIESFSKNVRLQNKYGIPSRIITPEEAREIVPLIDISEVKAASWNPTDGKANPFLAVRGLLNALKNLNAEVYPYTEVKEILHRGNEVKGVKTSRGEIRADIILNATNAWAKILNEKLGLKFPIEPYKHQAVITEPFKYDEIKPMVISFKYGGAYLTQEVTSGGVIGGIDLKYGPTWDLTTTYKFMREIAKNFTHIIPALKYIPLIRQWAGYYAETPDHNAVIGKVREYDGYYIAAGFSGHGFMLAPAATKGIVDIILHGKSDLPMDFYDPYRFERGELREQAIQMG